MKKKMYSLILSVVIGMCACNLVACESKKADEPAEAVVEEKVAVQEVKYDENATPFENYGNLQICSFDHDGDATTAERKQLCDQNGNPIQLKGMSTYGLQWNEGLWVINDSAFDALAYDWKCDVVRLAMYVQEEGYASKPKELLERVEKGIELSTARGMYVIVDWHVLSPGNPMDEGYLNAGLELAQEGEPFYKIAQKHPEYNGPQLFFAYLSQKYGAQGNVLFELANEPNCLGTETTANTTWSSKLKPYFEDVLAAVREYDADDNNNIVICGTDNWSQFVNAPINNELADDAVMYSVHFYAGTHDTGYDEEEQYWLRDKIDKALENGLAVFCSEWGTSEASGDGGPYIEFSERWLNYFEENKISWCAWSMAKKAEGSASCTSEILDEPTDLNGDAIPEWDSSTLTVTGNYLRAKIRGEEVPACVESIIAIDFEGNLEQVKIDTYSTNQKIILKQKKIEDTALMIGSATGEDIWMNRVALTDLGTNYGVYQSLIFDLIVKDEDVKDAAITIKPVIQTEANEWWGDAIEQQTFNAEHFTSMGNGYSVCHASYSMESLSPDPADTLGHIQLLLATGNCQNIYIDNVGFSSVTNGDVRYKAQEPEIQVETGGLPFIFESGDVEGWSNEDTEGQNQVDLEVGLAETNALKFALSFDGTNNAWEDGARITTPQFPKEEMTLEWCKKISTVEFDVYLEPEKATKGSLDINVCPIPNGAGYWYLAGNVVIDPVNGGEKITNSEGTTLLKYHVSVPFSEDGNYPYTEEVAVKNLILIFSSVESDYDGYVYCDNVDFTIDTDLKFE